VKTALTDGRGCRRRGFATVVLLAWVSIGLLQPARGSQASQVAGQPTQSPTQASPATAGSPPAHQPASPESEHTLAPKFGGLATGQGPGFGVEYRWDYTHTFSFQLRSAAQASPYRATRAELEFSFQATPRRHLFVDAYTAHRRYPRVDYYGPGPSSRKQGRSAFLYEDFAVDLTAGTRLAPGLEAGASGGYIQINTGPGRREDVTSIERVYAPAFVPGLEHQASFWRWGGFLQLDHRDNPSSPTGGGLYRAEYSVWRDRRLGQHHFALLEARLQYFAPLGSTSRVLAAQAQVWFTFHRRGQTVPYYLQPALGGPDGLRGFRAYRFRDDRAMLFTAEYRHKLWGPAGLALFADAGKVFPSGAPVTLNHLEFSPGIGLRFDLGPLGVARLDFALSHEGRQVWIRLGDLFSPKPVGRSSPRPLL